MSTRTAFTVVGAVVGAIVGYYTGNVALGIQVGTAIGGLVGNEVDPVKLYGPRLGDAKLQAARDGVPIPWGLGRFRVTGTVIACQPGPPTETEAESRESKGSGPVNVNYNYTRTVAILICEGPILGVRRIWRDNKLVYDVSDLPEVSDFDPATATSVAELLAYYQQMRAQSSSFAAKIRLYNGTEDQMPDSALEAMFGAGNVSAFRGTAYMVVPDDDVTQRGGSLSQYDFEVLVAGTAEPYEDGSITSLIRWDIDYTDLMGSVWTPLAEDGSTEVDVGFGRYGGSLRGHGGYAGIKTPWTPKFDFSDDTVNFTMGIWYYGLDVLNAGWGTNIFCWRPDTNTATSWYIDGSGLVGFNNGGSLVLTSDTVIDANQWYYLEIGREDGIGYLSVNAVIEDEGPMTNLTYPVGVDAQIGAGFYASGQTNLDGYLDDFFCVKGVAIKTEVLPTAPAFSQVLPDSPAFAVDNNGNLFYIGGAGAPDTLTPYEPTVKECLDLIAARTYAQPDEYDFSALASDITEGFFVAREAQGDGVIGAIAQAYFFDCAEIDGKLRSVKRGANSVLTLDINDLAAREGAPVTETRDQEIERPRKLNVVYADPELAYIPTKQTAQRLTTIISAIGERSIELNVVMGRDQAAQIADKAIKIVWTDLNGTVALDLPNAFSYLTPTDVIILNYRGKNQRLRIDSIAHDSGRMSIVCRQDRQSAYTSDVEGVGKPSPPSPPALLGATRLVFLNTYPLRDEDDRFGFYIAATGVFPTWPGALIQYSIDDGATWADGGMVFTKAIIGTLVDALPEHPAEYMDYGSTLRVTIGDRSLSSISELQLLQEQNACAIVALDGTTEVLQFQNAVDEGGGIFALTTLPRGRNGTPAVYHAPGESFVMLNDAVFIETPTSLLGKQIKVRAVTRGTPAANNASYDEDFTVAYIQTEHAPDCLLPYRVGDDISLYWSGQGLLGTPANSYVGSKFQGYQITFSATFSSGVETVTKDVLGQSYIYSAADQTTDFGAPVAVGDLQVEIRQKNAITGLGPALVEII